MPKNIVIYHKNCPDGSTAAAIAFKKFGTDAIYIACSHGDGLPEEVTLCNDKKSTNIYILDFSFSLELLREIEQDFASLTVLDHHISVKDVVESVKGGHFDNSKSGASLSWQYFFKDIPEPAFVALIESIDLFKDSSTWLDNMTTYISSIDYSLETYATLLDSFDVRRDEYEKEGIAINRYVTLLESMITDDFDVVEFEGVKMPAVNMTFDISTRSRILNRLYTQMPPVAMSYHYKNKKWKISLRSNKEFDVSRIASKYGGGGHACAAGCAIDAPNMEPFFKYIGKWKDIKDTL